MSTLPALQWRYSPKHFSDRKVPQDQLLDLIEAARLSASSYGLQPYKIWVVEDKAIREKLAEHAYQQPQIKQSSHLLIIANETQIGDQIVDRYFQHLYQQTNTAEGSIEGYVDHIKSAIGSQTHQQRQSWAQQQAYIALGALLSEAAMQKIDACPMTGFEPDAFNRILGLTGKHLNACVICAIGYRKEMATPTKVRLPIQEFAHFFA
jgi:nitroreductase